ncbi:hypothetical protein J4045_22745, partial [Klebsiella aerogenes]
ADNIAPTAWVP